VTDPFRWQDGERLVVFGRGCLAQAPGLLGDGYLLLTTPRAAAAAPAVVDGAGTVAEVGPGRVDELAGSLRASVGGELIVALGGGRVIDVAKAIAAAEAPRRVAAIPTTLSGAEMTAVHRHAAGVPFETPRVRPQVVINDPELSASQPLGELAQSAANALGHAVEGPLTPLRNPVATDAALHSARLIGRVFAPGPVADGPGARDALALGALLAGYVIGSTGYGLHHVLSQTLVRFARLGHGEANSIMLKVSAGALRRRFPAELERLDGALGAELSAFAQRLCEVAGRSTLREAAFDESLLESCVEEAAIRPELALTPPPADRDELRALYEAAL
jgi:alcohol dehydrogenase class IV